MKLYYLFWFFVPSFCLLSISPHKTKDSNIRRLDLVTENPLQHPEIIRVIICTSNEDPKNIPDCTKNKDSYSRVLFDSQIKRDGIKIDNEERVILINTKTSIITTRTTNHWIQIEAWIKNSDGTKAQEEPCVLKENLNQEPEKHEEESKEITQKPELISWVPYALIGLGGFLACFFLFFVGIKIVGKLKQNVNNTVYGGTYNFSNSSNAETRQPLSRREREREEDMELGRRLGYLQ